LILGACCFLAQNIIRSNLTTLRFTNYALRITDCSLKEKRMSIQDYLRILRRRGWIILAAVILAGAAAFGVSSLQVEMYRATVQVSTVPARPDWGLGNMAKDLMRNFAMNIRTPEVAQRAIDRAKLDMNPYDFLGMTTVSPDSSTFVVKIEARSRDQEVAKQMALALADEFVEERTAYYAQQDKENRIEVKIVSRAIEAPRYQPQPMLNAVAGAVLGLLLGIAVVLLLTWMEADLLRTPESVERTLTLPVLGAIPTLGGQSTATAASVPQSYLGKPKTA
jgi:capsular polysaccharide biosynthesis protein